MLSTQTLGRPVNGSRAQLTKIGVVHVSEPFTSRRHEQTACNYTDVKVAEGDYDVVLHQGIGPAWVIVGFHGIVVDEFYLNRLFGSTSIAEKRNIGQEHGASAQLHPYIAAEQFAINPIWEIAEDWEVRSQEREYTDGRPYTAYSLHYKTEE
jgi:hypothetical protein